MIDILHQILCFLCLAPKNQPSATITQPTVVDMLGFLNVVFDIQAGVSADTIDGANGYTFTLQESDEAGSGFADVDPSDILGSDSAVIATLDGIDLAEGACKSVQYVGTKRYTKVVIAAVGTATNGTVMAINAVKINPIDAPTQ